MDFLWTWAVVPCRTSMLHTREQTQHALLCSILSVTKHYPKARKRFLVCKETYAFLKQKNWLRLWDSVEIIDFPIENPGFQKYYAYPKVYTTRFVENPTIILDVETIIRKPLEILEPSKVTGASWRYRTNPEEEKADLELDTWFGLNYQRDFYPSKGNQYIGAWCYYVPGKKAAEYTSVKTCLHIDRVLGQFPMKYGYGPACFLEDGYISHCYEEICGINFEQSTDWYSSFFHSLEDKWDLEGCNYQNEIEGNIEGVYRDFFVKTTKTPAKLL